MRPPMPCDRSTGVAVVVGQLEIPQRVTAAGFRAARERGAVTILNPAPAAPLDPELLDAADWLIPNETEFAILAGLDRFDPADDRALVAFAQRIGPRLAVTLGSAGVAVVRADGTVARVAAEPVTAVDTTGAGDAFVGAFAFGLAAGLDEMTAVRLAIACASDSVTRHGTQSSYPTREGAKADPRSGRRRRLRRHGPDPAAYSSKSSQPPSSPGMKNALSG